MVQRLRYQIVRIHTTRGWVEPTYERSFLIHERCLDSDVLKFRLEISSPLPNIRTTLCLLMKRFVKLHGQRVQENFQSSSVIMDTALVLMYLMADVYGISCISPLIIA